MERRKLVALIVIGILAVWFCVGMGWFTIFHWKPSGSTTKDIGNTHYHIKYDGNGWETKAYTFSDVNTTYEVEK